MQGCGFKGVGWNLSGLQFAIEGLGCLRFRA